jgi:hypothetical protein
VRRVTGAHKSLDSSEVTDESPQVSEDFQVRFSIAPRGL